MNWRILLLLSLCLAATAAAQPAAFEGGTRLLPAAETDPDAFAAAAAAAGFRALAYELPAADWPAPTPAGRERWAAARRACQARQLGLLLLAPVLQPPADSPLLRGPGAAALACLDAAGKPLEPRPGRRQLKPWSAAVRERLAAALLGLRRDLAPDGVLLDGLGPIRAAVQLDAEAAPGFYGRGNPDRLELPLWLAARRDRLAKRLAAALRAEDPALVVGRVDGAAADRLAWRDIPPAPLSGTVRDENGRPLADAAVSLRAGAGDPLAQTQSDADGYWCLPLPAKAPKAGALGLRWEYDGAPALDQPLAAGAARADAVLPGAAAAADRPWLKLLRPGAGVVRAPACNLLGRTLPGNRVYLRVAPPAPGAPESWREIPVLGSGAFFLDGVALEPGANRLALRAVDPQARAAEYPLVLERQAPAAEPPAPAPAWAVQSPLEDMLCLSGDSVELRVAGPAGWEVQAVLFGGKISRGMAEYAAPERPGGADYLVRLTLPDDKRYPAARVSFLCTKPHSRRTVRLWSPASVSLRKRQDPLVAESVVPSAAVSWGRHDVRLGGPYAAEVNQGTRFQVTGRVGSRYRVRLSSVLDGWVDADDLRLLPETTPQPHGYFTFCQVSGGDGVDRIWMPVKTPVPYAITPRWDEAKGWRLELDFFNAHLATTWFSHLESRKIVGLISGEQLEEDHFRLTIPVAGPQLWGYWMESVKGGMWLNVKYPPALHRRPLEGLVIGLDAGHGGEQTGAVGYMGTIEKTTNSWFCDDLAAVLAERGATAVLLRPNDYLTPFDERLKTAVDAKAALILSIHANAGDMGGGFGSLAGPSVYYKYDYSRGPAEAIYRKLVGLFGKGDGLVGNFNFNLLRRTAVPDVLVETAYLSNPAEEAFLLDRKSRLREAEAIADGLEDWLEGLQPQP